MTPQDRRPITTLIAVLAALAALFAGGSLVVSINEDGTVIVRPVPAPPAAMTPTPAPVAVPGVDAVQPDSNQTRDVEEQAEGELAAEQPRAIGPDGHEDLRDETPPGVGDAQAREGLTQTDAPGLTGPLPVGGAQNYSCPDAYGPGRFVANRSSRNGQKPLLAVLHYTVSANRPGKSDVNAIRDLFNRPSFGASSTYVIDFEGNCLKLVPESMKPWTQGNFNGRSISVEIIATGSETSAQWRASPLIKRGILAALWRDVMRRNGIPIRRVDPVGCEVQRAGWTDHDALECGNDHHDVTPNFPYGEFTAQLAAGGRPRTEAQRSACRKIAYHRKRVRGGAAWHDRVTSAGKTQARSAYVNDLKASLERVGVDSAACR